MTGVWVGRRAALGAAIAVFLGAAAGTGVRAAIGIYVESVSGHVVINVAGSFLLGLLVAAIAGAGQARLRLLLGTGVLGGFTTYSAFALDAVLLAQHGQILLAVGYVAVSVLGGLLVAGLGLALGARWRAAMTGDAS